MMIKIGISLICLYYFILFFDKWKAKRMMKKHIGTILQGIETSTCLADLVWWTLMVENVIEINNKHKILKRGDIKW